MHPFKLSIVCVVAFAMLGSHSSANLLVSEDFDYDTSVSDALSGKGGTVNGWDSTWTGGGSIVDTSANPLAVGLVSGGDQALQIGSSNSNEAANRSVLDAINSNINDQTIWISYLLRYVSGNKGGERVHLHSNESNWDHRYFGYDEEGSNGDFRFSPRYNNSQQQGGPEFNVGDTVLLVMKLTSYGSDWIHHDVWINPGLEEATGMGDLSFAGSGSTRWRSLPGIGLTERAPGDTFQWDRFRVGTTFISVMPEPSSAALLGLAGLALVRRRRAA